MLTLTQDADAHARCVQRQVRRLQARIVKWTQAGKHNKVKALQWLLTHSFSGKALAVIALVSARMEEFGVPEQRRMLDTFVAQIALALGRVHYVEIARDALVSMESERLRNLLLSAISHDLRAAVRDRGFRIDPRGIAEHGGGAGRAACTGTRRGDSRRGAADDGARDLGLPDIDGIEVIRGLRDCSAVPVIVLSARTQEEDEVAALNAGADDYLIKPFGSAELIARIRVRLRRQNGHIINVTLKI